MRATSVSVEWCETLVTNTLRSKFDCTIDIYTKRTIGDIIRSSRAGMGAAVKLFDLFVFGIEPEFGAAYLDCDNIRQVLAMTPAQLAQDMYSEYNG